MADPLFDERALAQRRARALRRTSAPFLAARVVEELAERLTLVRRQFGTALVTGCPPDLAERLSGVAEHVRFTSSIDALAEIEPMSLDLLLVVGELDIRDELPVLLRIAASRLASGGHLAGAIPGGQSLPALQAALLAAGQASGRVAPRTHPRIEPGALAGLLGAAGLVDALVDIDRVRLRYRSLGRLVGDLRDHAATNVLCARSRHSMNRAELSAAEQAFAALAEDGATEEQVELLFFSAWAPNNRS